MDSTVTHNRVPHSVLSGFEIAKYRFKARVTKEIALPVYKGSAFHGGFGCALKAISPAFFQLFYQPPGQGEPPKPFVLLPPLEETVAYSLGDEMLFELVLIGSATQYFPVCFAAFEYLGQQFGFGKTKGCYQINEVNRCELDGSSTAVYKDGEWRLANTCKVAEHGITPQTLGDLTLQFKTRLRLKHNGQLLKQTPSFGLLLDRLLGRLCTLAKFYQSHTLLLRDERQALLNAAQAINVCNSTLCWNEWSRYSGRQKEWMQFGGLLGEVGYQGNLAPFLPYLRLGEWLHVGGKTSFGLGKYEIIERKG